MSARTPILKSEMAGRTEAPAPMRRRPVNSPSANSTTILMRDRIACRLCNFILRHLASPWYRAMIGGSISYGLNAAARDTGPPPMSWLDVGVPCEVDDNGVCQVPRHADLHRSTR